METALRLSKKAGLPQANSSKSKFMQKQNIDISNE